MQLSEAEMVEKKVNHIETLVQVATLPTATPPTPHKARKHSKGPAVTADALGSSCHQQARQDTMRHSEAR